MGSATNLPGGDVEVVAEGPRADCERLLHLLSETPAPPPPPDAHRTWLRRPGNVTGVAVQWLPAVGGLIGFDER